MDWEKVKRIFIYLLILLNVGLLSVNYVMNREYVLSSSQEKAIYKVLADRGVGMYTDLIKRTPPMRDLNVSLTPLEPLYYKEKFFDSNEEVKIVPEFDKTVLKSNNKSLTIKDNNIQFINPDGTEEIEDFNKKNALKAANDFLKKVSENANEKEELEDVTFSKGSYVFEYNERYKGYKLFGSLKKVSVSKKGITEFFSSYYTAENFTGGKKDIISCDQALLEFLKEIKKEGITGGIYIEKIELGYDFQNSDDIDDGSGIRLVPCYRIALNGNEKVYIINATE